MKTPARIGKHPIHPMMIALPLGLWSFSLICDLFYLTPWKSPDWATAALYTMAGGVAGALAAAVPGFIDFLSIRELRAKRTGFLHMTLNLTITVLYALNVYLRMHDAAAGFAVPFVLSLLSFAMLCLSGWLGAELIYVHKVSVWEKKEEPRTEYLKYRKAA